MTRALRIALAAGALALLLPEVSQAQWRGYRGGYGRGFSAGMSFGSGGYGYYPGSYNYYRGGFNPGGYGYYPGYSNYQFGYNPGFRSYYGPGLGYRSYAYDMAPNYPAYTYTPGPSYQASYFTPGPVSGASYTTPGGVYVPGATVLQEPSAAPVQREDPTRVNADIRLPAADAELWIEEKKMDGTGTLRQFVSPPLDEGGTYRFKAKWTENEKPVERTREVKVKPGDRVTVDFTKPDAKAEG